MNAMTKRLFSFLVVLAMVLSMVPVVGLPAIEVKAAEEVTDPFQTDLEFKEDGKTAYCPYCKADKVWTAYTTPGTTTTSGSHYYLASDMEYASGSFITISGTTCFHLNGHNITAKDSGAQAFQVVGTGRIMGNGIVTGNNAASYAQGATINVNGATAGAYIYGGTYKKAAGNAVSAIACVMAGGGTIALRGATIDGTGVENTSAAPASVFAIGKSGAAGHFEFSSGEVIGNVTIGYPHAGYAGAKLTMLGGNINGDVKVNGMNCIGLAVKGGRINGTLDLGGATVTLSQTAEVNKINVGTGKVEILAGWNGDAIVTLPEGALVDGIVSAERVSATGNYTALLQTSDGKRLHYTAAGISTDPYVVHKKNLEFQEDGKTAFCAVCGKDVEWTAYTTPGTTTKSGSHYYLASDIEYTSGRFMTVSGTTCFNLNGHNITAKDAGDVTFWVGGTLRVMGSGTVTGNTTGGYAQGATINITGGAAADCYIFGGTYKKAASNVTNAIACIQVAGGQLNFRGGVIDGTGVANTSAAPASLFVIGKADKAATANVQGGEIIGTVGVGYPHAGYAGAKFSMINGTVTGDISVNGANCIAMAISGGKVTGTVGLVGEEMTLSKTAIINNIDIDGTSKVTIENSWTGSAAVTLPADAVVDRVVSADRVAIASNLNGTLKLISGETLSYNDGVLSYEEEAGGEDVEVDYAADLVFQEDGKTAFCPVCKTDKEWTAYKAGDTVNVAGRHLYLADDETYSGDFLSGSYKTCFHLNGHNITAGEGGLAAFTVGATLNLMGTGIVTGNRTGRVAGATLHLNNANGACRFNIYGGTYKKAASNTDAAIVCIGANGGTINMYGGTIDASNSTTTNATVKNSPATAVHIIGKGVEANNARFYMHGGEIIGGTNAGNGGAIHVGACDTGDAYVGGGHFVMNGGTITGGTAKLGGAIYAGVNCGTLSIRGGTIQDGKAESGGNIYALGTGTTANPEVVPNAQPLRPLDVEIKAGTITGGEATVNGGNIYTLWCNLTIGEDAVISDGFIPFTNMSTFGGGGGNICFSRGIFTTSGKITGGKIEKFKGAGGNIFLDNGRYGAVTFIMNGGEISGGQIPVGNEAIYGGADPAGQNYGANIRAYNIQEMQLLGGKITGGIGGNPEKAHGRNVYLSCSEVVTNLTIGNVTIDGAVHLANHNLILKDAPKIVAPEGETGLTAGDGADVLADVSGLTEGANVQFSGVTPNVPFTAACDNAETVKNYVSFTEDCALNVVVVNNQLVLNGSAIVTKDGMTPYASNAAAVAAYTADNFANGDYIQLGVEDTLVLNGDEYYVDFAGFGGANVEVSGSGKLYAMDSANNDFEGGATWTYKDVELVRDVTVGDNRYITVTVDNVTSTHYLVMAIDGVKLNTEKAGLAYTASYQCDATLAGLVETYGIIASVQDMPGSELSSLDQRTELNTFEPDANHLVSAASSYITNIFKDTRSAAKNAEYGKMDIYANAYIQLDLDGDKNGEILVADTENAGKQAGSTMSLYEAMLYIDQNWAEFAAAEQEAVKAFYDAWAELGMSAYGDDFTYIYAKVEVEPGESSGTESEDTDMSAPV